MLKIPFGGQLNKPFVVALGYFDSMHVGHVALFDEAKRLARSLGVAPAIFTFDNNHFDVLGLATKPLFSFSERLTVYESCGAECVLYAHFDKAFMHTSATDFLTALLSYDVKGVVCGFDYTCGSDRKDCRFVKNFLEVRGVKTVVVDQVSVGGEKVSSSRIRKLIENCDVKGANQLLGRPFFLQGKVVNGRSVGRQIGFPTANLAYDDKLLPQGVFAGICHTYAGDFKAIVNVGAKPTFNVGDVSVEAHLLDFNGDLYGSDMTIFFTDFLRPTQKFSDVGSLIRQLQYDKEKVLND